MARLSSQGLGTTTYTDHCNLQDSVFLELSSRLTANMIDESSQATSQKGVLLMSGRPSYVHNREEKHV